MLIFPLSFLEEKREESDSRRFSLLSDVSRSDVADAQEAQKAHEAEKKIKKFRKFIRKIEMNFLQEKSLFLNSNFLLTHAFDLSRGFLLEKKGGSPGESWGPGALRFYKKWR